MTELEDLERRAHGGITSFDHDGTQVPCIVLDERRFDRMMCAVAGRAVSVDTNLNVIQDGMGHVFVDVSLSISGTGIRENVLVDARAHAGFFELLAGTSMLALTSPRSVSGRENVFMVQLPRPERAADALDMIRRGLQSGTG